MSESTKSFKGWKSFCNLCSPCLAVAEMRDWHVRELIELEIRHDPGEMGCIWVAGEGLVRVELRVTSQEVV